MKRSRLTVGLLIAVCATVRFSSISKSWQEPPPNRRAGFVFPQQSTDQVQILAYNHDAPVYLGPGPDGAPGMAGRDDGLPPDGVVDNLAELGAVNTDDQCIAPWDTGYEEKPGKPFVVAISRGSFLPTKMAPEREEKSKVRYVVHSESPGDPWSWILIQ